MCLNSSFRCTCTCMHVCESSSPAYNLQDCMMCTSDGKALRACLQTNVLLCYFWRPWVKLRKLLHNHPGTRVHFCMHKENLSEKQGSACFQCAQMYLFEAYSLSSTVRSEPCCVDRQHGRNTCSKCSYISAHKCAFLWVRVNLYVTDRSFFFENI